MPATLAAIGAFVVKTIGVVGVYSSTALAVVGAATVVAGAVVAKKLIDNIYAVPNLDSDSSRQATVRGTVEPQKLIYGEALVSGPISFVGVAGDENRDLYHAIVLAGHQSTAITDIHFDDKVITNAQIAANGQVTGGTFGPQNSVTICTIRKLLGTQTTADSVLDAAFGTINANEHIGTNLTYIVTKFTLTDESQEIWDKYLPQNIKALVKGKKIYDPRQDSTSTYYDASVGVATQRANDSTTWEWSENPVWCLVDYLTDDYFGMNIDLSRIDLAKAVDAADICDSTVSIPSGTEKRFTCNGVVFGTASHKANINKLLSSMNGMLTYTNGKFVIRAGAFEAVASGMTLNDDNLTGPAKLKTSFERNERFNTITGTFIDPSNNYKEMEFPKVQITSALTRDNNEELRSELKLSMTNSFYMAQRISHKLIQQSDLQKVLTFPTNLAGVNIAVGDRVSVTLSEFNYTNKTFVCLGWNLSESGAGGVNLILREDDSASYADMAVGSYSTVTPSGGIAEGFFGVPDPQNLSATALVEGIELDWTNPTNMTHIIAIEVFASPDSSWSNAVKVGETLGTQFLHDASNGVDPIADGDERYYWVRARRFPTGTGTDAVSDRNPDSDTSTINATRGALGALAGQDTVGDGQIDDNAVGTDQIADDAVTADQIADGAVELTAFASGIQPVQVVSTLPSTAAQGDMAFLTTDNKLYRYDGSAWTVAVDGGDIVANSITAGQIASGAINTDELAANAVTAAKIQASSITVDKLSGDVSELFPTSYNEQLTLTNSNQNTVTFTLPAPELSISKRIKVDLAFDYLFTNSSASTNTYTTFFSLQMKSKGATGVQVGDTNGVYHVSYPHQYNQLVYIAGNHLAELDTNGRVGRDSSGAGLGSINGVYYDGYLNRTYILVGQVSVVFTTGDTLFYSPTGFTSTGTFYAPSATETIALDVSANTTVRHRLVVSQTLGATTTATDFRGATRMAISYSNTTIKLSHWSGTLELIS